MSTHYDVNMSAADRNAISVIRRATTEIELAIQAPRGDFDFSPDPMFITQQCLIIMMQASNTIERHEGTDFGPSLIAAPGPAL